MTEEIWKAVVGFEGLYEVSNMGRVRSLDRYVTQMAPWGDLMTRRLRGKILAPQKHSGGYSQVQIKGRTYLTHALVLMAFEGPVPKGKECCHNDGNKENNRLSNLRYDVHVSNCADRKKHGTVVLGSMNPSSKLSENDIAAIRAIGSKMYQYQIADLFGVSQSHISRILRKEQWQHV